MHVSLQHPDTAAVFQVHGQGHTFCILSIREPGEAGVVDVYLSAEQLEMLATGLCDAIDADSHLDRDGAVVWSATQPTTRTDTRILERS